VGEGEKTYEDDIVTGLVRSRGGRSGSYRGFVSQGILEEESKQNLPAAIQAYQSVLTQYDNDRKTAAAALFRMAEKLSQARQE
jgi:hypothetical protein